MHGGEPTRVGAIRGVRRKGPGTPRSRTLRPRGEGQRLARETDQSHRGLAEAQPRGEGPNHLHRDHDEARPRDAARSPPDEPCRGIWPDRQGRAVPEVERHRRRRRRRRLAGASRQAARRASRAARSPARKAATQGRAGQGKTIPPSRVGASAGMRKESTQSPPVWMSAASS